MEVAVDTADRQRKKTQVTKIEVHSFFCKFGIYRMVLRSDFSVGNAKKAQITNTPEDEVIYFKLYYLSIRR
jgi:hypothetical protein